MIEVKDSNHDITKALYEFKEKYQMPAVQIVKNLRYAREVNGITVMKAEDFLSQLMV